MGVGSSRLSSSRSSAASTAAGPVAASPAAAAPAAPGLFSRFRRPAVHAAAGAVTGAAGGVEGGRRFKLRSFTSVDLPVRKGRACVWCGMLWLYIAVDPAFVEPFRIAREDVLRCSCAIA